MIIKWAFYALSILFLLNTIGCHIITEYLANRSSKVRASYRREEISCKAASAISAAAKAKGKITVAWDINKDEKVAGYKVYYGLFSRGYKDCVDIGNPADASPGVIKYTLIDLEEGRKYYIAIVAYDKNNNKSAFSSEITGIAE